MIQLAEERSHRVLSAAAPSVSRRGAKRAGEILCTHAQVMLSGRRLKAPCPALPLPSLYVASFLRQNGYRVAFYDTTFRENIDHFTETVRARQPLAVYLHRSETTRSRALAMVSACARLRIPVIVGGDDPLSEPGQFEEAGADVILSGECERSAALAIGEFAGGNRNVTKIRAAVARACTEGSDDPLEELPFPARDLIDVKSYFEVERKINGSTSLEVQAARGCPYRCSWCAATAMASPYRLRQPAHVAEELQFIKMLYRPDQVTFGDRPLIAGRAWADELGDEIHRRRARIPFECLMRVDAVDEDTVWALRDAGCVRIWYEVASGSPRILEALRQNYSVADVRRAAEMTRRSGLEVGYSLLLGHPSENIDDFEKTRRLVRETHPNLCRVSLMSPVPGTELFNEVKDHLLPQWHEPHDADDNILGYRGRYSQNYYDMARLLLSAESTVYGTPQPPLSQKIKYHLYRVGYGLMTHPAGVRRS